MGNFFAKLVVGIGLLQLIAGTIGLLVWGMEETRVDGGWLFADSYERPNLPFALAAIVSNVFVSSLCILLGVYIYERLSEMGREQTK